MQQENNLMLLGQPTYAYDECTFAMGQVAAALAELPLAPALQRLERVFAALNTVCAFLLTQHIQACPSVTSAACEPASCMLRCLQGVARRAMLSS